MVILELLQVSEDSEELDSDPLEGLTGVQITSLSKSLFSLQFQG